MLRFPLRGRPSSPSTTLTLTLTLTLTTHHPTTTTSLGASQRRAFHLTPAPHHRQPATPARTTPSATPSRFQHPTRTPAPVQSRQQPQPQPQHPPSPSKPSPKPARHEPISPPFPFLTSALKKQKQKQNPNPNPSPEPPRPRNRTTLLVALLTTATLLTLTLTTALPTTTTSPTLNPSTFTPFTITARTQLSPTAFLLTLSPAPPPPTWRDSLPWNNKGRQQQTTTGDVVGQAWEEGALWSVEVKQPELQVARDYTPLPACSAVGEEGSGEVRLYIRRMEKGEVSGYLARLGVGEVVELRGPRGGFDLKGRVGSGDEEGEKKNKKVVFLAGGTGIAPALQAARTLLEKTEGVDMEVVWANRRREDCVADDNGGVVAMLEAFRTRYPARFRYSCTVDEEGSVIDAGTITRSTELAVPAPAPARSLLAMLGFWAGRAGRESSTAPAVPAVAVAVDSAACAYHGAKKLAVSDDGDAPAGAAGQQCQCKDAQGNRVTGGKNLLIVSGPDGFVGHYAGAKVWGVGKELQGPVKGVIGDLQRKYPSLGEDWLVLKM